MAAMTEAEWRTCANPARMLGMLHARWGTATRKGKTLNLECLRLFACACCRRLADLLGEEDRQALAMIEDYARTGQGDLRAIRRIHARERIAEDPPSAGEATRLITWARRLASSAVWEAAKTKPTSSTTAHKSTATAAGSLAHARHLLATVGDPPPLGGISWYRVADDELAVQAHLLRDVVGNPFRPATLDPAWLATNDGAIARLAQAIDAERAHDRLPILGDALEEAGCADPEILGHCRSPGPHVLGCWVVELALDRR
jgi:hypothetical protein